jgi:hypothetical protein
MVRCWGCKQPALCICWSKAAGYFSPSCGNCPIVDPTMPGELVWLGYGNKTEVEVKP